MEKKICLNCGSELFGAYCQDCGQKASTQRITFKNLFKDFFHGVTHMDKGFLYSFKELIIRPGHGVRDYLQGKRKNHFNPFTLVLILFVLSHYENILLSYLPFNTDDIAKGNDEAFFEFLDHYYKYLIFSLIPVMSFFSYILFKKIKLFYTEHLIVNTFCISGILVINLFTTIFYVFTSELINGQFLQCLIIAVIFLYTLFFYYQFFSGYNYKKIKIFINWLLIFIISIIIFLFVLLLFYKRLVHV